MTKGFLSVVCVQVGWRDGRLEAEKDDDDHRSFTCSRHHHHHHHHQPKLQQLAREEEEEEEGGGGGGGGSRRWMVALQPARDRHEQNVEVVAEGGRLVLHVLKPVRRGERLLLWYSDSLARAFGVPILTPAHIRGRLE